MAQTVLVVGGAGYIGAHAVRDLQDAGHDVVVFDNLSTGHRAAVSAPLIVGDVRDPAALDAVFEAHKIDAVMHFAALALVAESVRNPMDTYHNNVLGTLALLRAMERAGVDKLIFSSTCAVYGEPQYLPLDEEHPCRPVSPYGTSKLMIDNVLRDLGASSRLRSVCFRYFNAAGAHPDGSIGESHDPETHLIPSALEVILGRRSGFKVFGTDFGTRDGTCTRDYVHVCDLAAAHRLAVEYLMAGGESGVWNLGTESGCTVLEVLQSVARVTGKEILWEPAPRRAGDAPGLYAGAHAARATFGWEPRFRDIDAIVETAWRWMRAKRY